MSPFETLCVFCCTEHESFFEMKKIILNGLSIFFKEKVNFFFNEKDAFFYLGELKENKYITKDNFEEIKDIISKQNCYKKTVEDNEFNPANEAATKLAEKIKAMRKKVSERKKEDSLTLFDLISVLASNSNNLNILNIWDLSIFQFNDQFNRMQMIEEYEININSLLHGADSKKINLKHYLRKINK